MSDQVNGNGNLELIVDNTYTIVDELGKGNMGQVFLSDVDEDKFDWVTLYAYKENRAQKTSEGLPDSRDKHFKDIEKRIKQLKSHPEALPKVKAAIPDSLRPSKKCALKLSTNLDHADRFEGEWKNLLGINHPNVIKVYGGGKTNFRGHEVLYYSMEALDGVIDSKYSRKLPLRQKLDIIKRAALGLDELRDKRLVHRDVKLDNILSNLGIVQEDGSVAGLTNHQVKHIFENYDQAQLESLFKKGETKEVQGLVIKDVKVSDTGIAKDLWASSGRTKTQTFMGTPNYASPEQVADAKNVDSRADVYSLGAVLYEMLTGKTHLPKGMDVLSMAAALKALKDESERNGGRDLYQMRKDKDPRLVAKLSTGKLLMPESIEPSEAPENLVAVVEKMMNPNRNFRYDTAGEVAREMECLMTNRPTSLEREPARSVEVHTPHLITDRRNGNGIKKGKSGLYWSMVGGGIAAAVLGIAAIGYSLVGGKKIEKPVRLPKPPPVVKVVEPDVVKEPVVEEPSPLEQYRKFEPTAAVLEKDIKKFLENGNTNSESLADLQKRLNEVYPQVTGFQGQGVEEAEKISKTLFSYITELASRKTLVEGYNEFSREIGKLGEDLNLYDTRSIKEQDLIRFSEKIKSAKEQADNYREKGLSIDGLAARLASYTGRVSNLQEKLRNQKEEASEQKQENLLEEAYSNFSSKVSRSLFGDIEDYKSFADYSTEKLDELIGKIKEAQTELGKYDGREGAQELTEKLNGYQKQLSDIEKFIKSSKGRILLSQISSLENQIKEYFENPDKKEKARLIRRTGFLIGRAARDGDVISDPLVAKLKRYAKRVEEGKVEEKPLVEVPKNSVLVYTFDEGTVVYNRQEGAWYVLDLSPHKNHGRIHGKFAGDVRTGKPIVYGTPADVPELFDLALVKGQSGDPRDYSMDLLGKKGYIEINDCDNLDIQKNIKIGLMLRTEIRPSGWTDLINKWSTNNDFSRDSWSVQFNHDSPNPRFTIQTYNNKIELYNVTSPNNLNDNVWHYLECIFDNSILQLYLDKTLVGSTSIPSGKIINTTDSNIIIGKHPQNGRFNGSLDFINIIYISHKRINN